MDVPASDPRHLWGHRYAVGRGLPLVQRCPRPRPPSKLLLLLVQLSQLKIKVSAHSHITAAR